MRRRIFCAAGLAAIAATSIPFGRSRAGSSGSDIAAKGLDGRELTLSATDVEDLRAGLRGELIGAGDAAYDTARRLWNPDFDLRPSLIVRCLGAADVRRAVNLAAAHGLLTAVRGGDHSQSGQSGCNGSSRRTNVKLLLKSSTAAYALTNVPKKVPRFERN